MEHDVFISHAHHDKSIADAICDKLESAGIKCWSAARDISADQDRTEATLDAIGSSQVIVVVLSENANAALNIKGEIAHAFYTRRTTIPLRLADTSPRRDFLLYLGNLSWSDAARPPSEQDLEALTARIKRLLPGFAAAGDAIPPQRARRTAATLSYSNSWIGDPQSSHHQIVGILKWVAIATALFAVVWFLWFTLWQTKERVSLAESQRRTAEPGLSVFPKTSPQAGSDGSATKPADVSTPWGSSQSATDGPTPLIQQASQDAPPNTPAEQPPSVTPSPRLEANSAQRAGLTSAMEPQGRPLPAPGMHRAPHYHQQQYQGATAPEPHKNTDLATSQRDAFQSQIKAAEVKVRTTEKSLDLMTIQLDALQNELKESEAKAQMVQKNADILTSERDALRDQLQEAANRADLVARQRDALEIQLAEMKEKEQLAEAHATLAASQRSAMEVELRNAEEQAHLAQENADLAASQRSALEAQLSNTRDAKAHIGSPDANLVGFNNSGPNNQPQEERGNALPANENVDLATNQSQSGLMQPPNPGHNAKLAPLTQALDPSVQPVHP